MSKKKGETVVPEVELEIVPEVESETVVDEWKEQAMRIQAEYENFRKRTARERETLYNDARADTLAELLSVYDNLKRAAGHPTQDAAYAKGVEMTLQQFDAVLEKFGVQASGAAGDAFDPNLHEAVMHVEDDSYGPSTIVEVFSQGFVLNGKVLRHAMVRVAN